MSNSVYMGTDGKEVFQTYVTPENFALTAEAAKAKPISIHVERTAVRVEVAQKESKDKYDTGYEFVLAGNAKKVYAKITGWDIVTVPTHAYTVKKIDLNWGTTINGFEWNKPSDSRSFWADAQYNADEINKSFS